MEVVKKRKLSPSKIDQLPNKKKRVSESFAYIPSEIKSYSGLHQIPVARFCSLNQSNPSSPIIKWDTEKIHACLSEEELSDQLLLSNIVTGHIINGKLWPIILDSSSDPLVQKRSLKFMESLSNDWSIYQTLNEQEVMFLYVGLRDLWLADSRGLLSPNEKSLLNSVLDKLEDDLVPSAQHQSLTFSFCPSKNRRVFKFTTLLEEESEIDPILLQSVARMKIKLSEGDYSDEILYVVWVDPRELSYHNYEFILPLDRALKRKSNDKLDFKITDLKKLGKWIYKGKLVGEDTNLMLQLDKLGLYQKPANSSTRGGERFVFSSSALSSGLTEAIRDSRVLTKKLQYRSGLGFQFVNYVFRCNRFSPNDAKFDMHFDTPYYDPERKHISQYTMIIYLSSGSGKPVLKVLGKKKNEILVDKVETLEFIIFNQSFKHEGYPFIDNDKIFLRTELIFSYKPSLLKHEPEVSKLFSSAIYMTLESSFQPELSKYAHQLYEQVNAVHWGLEDVEESTPPLVLHKIWSKKLHFATNGTDYWFPLIQRKSDKTQDQFYSTPLNFIKIASLIAALDYLNAQIRDLSKASVLKHFRKHCHVEKILPPKDCNTSCDWILKHLWSSVEKTVSEANLQFVPTNTKSTKKIFSDLLPNYSEVSNDDQIYNVDSEESVSESGSDCCPFHNSDEEIDIMNYKALIHSYRVACKRSLNKLCKSAIYIYNNEIHLDTKNITIENEKIFINIPNSLPAVNFASCWPEPPEAYIGSKFEFEAPKLLMPPISFVMIDANEKTGSGPGVKLMMDFFKNDWIMPNLGDLTDKVSVPMIGPVEQ